MARYRKTVISGDVIEIEEYTSVASLRRCCTRSGNVAPTEEEKNEWNRLQSIRNLCRLINTNFGVGDLFITLTHRAAVGADQAAKELTNFLRRLKRWRKKNGCSDLKYIAVTESAARREHHHLIINAMPMDVISELWGLGRVMISKLEPGGDYTGLACYITKEEKAAQKRRWRQSRNLERPKVILKEIKAKRPRKITPPKGYFVVESYEYVSQYGMAAYLRAVKSGGCDYGTGAASPEG